MSASNVILNLICEPDMEEEIERAFNNSGVNFSKERLSENNYKIYLPNQYGALSLTLHIISSKIDELRGVLELPNGEKYELTSEGIKKFEQYLVEEMSKEREIISVPTDTQRLGTKTLLDYTPEQWSEFVNTVGEVWIKIKTAGSSEKKYLAYPVYILIGIIFVGFVYLALNQIIDSQSVTFLFGIIIGSLIPFLREFIIPEQA